jgi:hypothetical protein
VSFLTHKLCHWRLGFCPRTSVPGCVDILILFWVVTKLGVVYKECWVLWKILELEFLFNRYGAFSFHVFTVVRCRGNVSNLNTVLREEESWCQWLLLSFESAVSDSYLGLGYLQFSLVCNVICMKGMLSICLHLLLWCVWRSPDDRHVAFTIREADKVKHTEL